MHNSIHSSMHKYHNPNEPASPAFGKGPVGGWCGTISGTLKGEMTTEVAKQHALDRPMSHPTGEFISEVWHGPPSWRRKHLEVHTSGRSTVYAPSRACRTALRPGARPRAGLIRSIASRLMSSPG